MSVTLLFARVCTLSTSSSIGIALYGLQRQTDSNAVRAVIEALAPKIAALQAAARAQSAGAALGEASVEESLMTVAMHVR